MYSKNFGIAEKKHYDEMVEQKGKPNLYSTFSTISLGLLLV